MHAHGKRFARCSKIRKSLRGVLDINHPDDQLLSQHIDGELSATESAALLTRLEQEPELAKRLQHLSGVNTMLQDAFTSTTVDPPEHIIKLLQPDPDNVVSLPHPGPRPFWRAAIAASLLAGTGFLAGQQWPGAALPERELPGATVVHAALESQRSSATDWIALDSGFQLRPVLSFTDKSGAYCREYEVADNRRNWRGVACRERGDWRTQVLVARQSAPTSSGQYRAAGTEGTALVTQFIDQHIDGIPLGAEEESARIRNGWR